MARRVLDPNDPEASRQALLDQLGPDTPLNGTAPQTPGYQSVTGAPRSAPSATGPTTPLDPSAGPNPVEPNVPPPAAAAPPVEPSPRIGTLPVPTPPNPDLGVQHPPNEGAPKPLTPGPGPTPPAGSLDPATVVADWMAHNNPQGHQDAAYWLQRIAETGGLTAANLEYWKSRFMEAPGTHQEGPGGFSGSNLTAAQGFGLDPQTSAYNQQMRQFMLAQLGQLSGPTDMNSPDIAPALSAFDTQSQRDQQRDREATAERFYAQGEGGTGLQSGGFNTALQQGRETASTNRANFAGTTVYNASQAKRQRLQELLQTASSAGLTDQAQAIQMQIARIDADLRRQGLNQQNSQFGDQLGFSYADLRARMNRDALLSGLGGGG